MSLRRYSLVLFTMMGAVLGLAQSISPTTLPQGTVSTAYSQQLTVVNLGSATVNSWSSSATPPAPGITLNSQGLLSGTPTQAGSFNFTVTANLSTGGPVNRDYTLTIIVGQITPTTLPTGRVGTAYSQQLTANATVASWSSSVTPPAPGITFSSQTGLLSGTPTQAGSFNFTVTAELSAGGTASQAYTLAVCPANGCPLSINETTMPGATQGAAYTFTPTATGGITPYEWFFGTPLPDSSLGFAIDRSTGTITGTPTRAGNFTVIVIVRDVNGQTSIPSTLTVTVTSTFSITTTSLPNGTVGVLYSPQTIQQSGGTAPITWSVSSGSLPAGLTLTPSSDTLSATVSGTPTTAGSSTFTISASFTPANSSAVTASQAFTIVISPPTLTITPPTVLTGTVGTAWLTTGNSFTVAGGAAPYTFAVTGGTLPAGLTLNASTGAITGTPTAAGTSGITVRVTDALSATASSAVSLVIAPQPVPAVTIGPSTAGPAQQPAVTVSIASPYTSDIRGTITLFFTSTVGADNLVRFSTGGQTTTFVIFAGSTQAVVGTGTVNVLTGTTAGTITLRLTALTDGTGADILPRPTPPSQTITINSSVPVISTVRIVTVTGGFNVIVTGYSTPHNMTSGLFHFTPTTGTNLTASDITLQLGSVFTTWYNSATSNNFGSLFTLTVPFTTTTTGGTTTFPVSTVTVKLTNSVGDSATSSPVSP